MAAAVMTKVHEIRFETWPVPKPGPGQVLVRTLAVGICGSDIHWFFQGKLGGATISAPLVLGHEAAGIVVQLGEGVTNLAVGDRICLEPGVPCGQCAYCRSGRYNLCRSIKFYGTPRGGTNHGTFREYLVHPAAFAFKLPDNVDFECGAMVEPFSVGIRAAQQAGIALGHKVLIYGAGPIGLVTMFAVKAAGAGEIWVTEPRKDRLQMAEKLGANRIASSSQDVPTGYFDAVLECAAAQPALRDCPRTVGPGGTIVMVGTFTEVNFPLDLITMMLKEARLTTVWRYVNSYPVALNLMGSGRVDLRPLVTHRFSFSKLPEALEFAHAGQLGAIKTVVTFEG
jgi:L-iditol 2-dehydrogenase